jgi:hypothetical protein
VKDVESGQEACWGCFQDILIVSFIPNKHGYGLVILCSGQINEKNTLTAWSDTLCVSCTPSPEQFVKRKKKKKEQGQKLRWKQDLNLRGETPSDN